MRLICPNCDAEYEVDDAAIPEAGRDVQCSNCGHAWFQGPLVAERADIATDQMDDAPAVAPPEVEAPNLPPLSPMPAARTVDDSVLAILKEEAELELAARKAEAIPVETQPDLGLEVAGAAARLRQLATIRDDAPSPPVDNSRQVTRRELLPDIEEINSTLRPSAAIRHDEADADDIRPYPDRPQPARSGFRNGFVLMLVLAAVLVTLYIMAPRLAQQMPGAKGALDAYVSGIDAARVGLDSATKSIIAALQRLAGSE